MSDNAKSAQDIAAAKIMDQAYEEMHDTRYDWLRRAGSRRVLVVVTLVCAALLALGIVTDRPFVLAGGILGYLACLFLGRRAVRLVVDLPDDCLDERQLVLRNDVYRQAYVWLGAVVALGWLAAFFAYGVFQLPVERSQVYGITLTSFVLVFSLPTLVYAWRVPHV